MNQSSDRKPDTRIHQQTRTAEHQDNASVEAAFDYEVTQQRQGYGASDNMSNGKRRSLITYNHITYFLYVISYFTAGLLWIVPIVMNYAKRHDAEGSWLATHFDWQIKTFWYSIVFFFVGIIIITFALGGFGLSMLADSGNIAIGSVLLAVFGLLIMIFTFIWHLYRIVRGWIALTDGRPVP
ncbi:DUF4870 family protein [Psychrobacter aquimaris]|jgi:uncharacterized membrane protein|uniref:DUF4870 family protein n=1 Tax=Psychrobacter aquimaris TaxID=292733 RepID=UPI003FD3C9E2